MTALIDGVTLHSFFKIPFMHKDGTTKNVNQEEKSDMSPEYVQYQALRFVFIDEFSTLAINILAEINSKTSKHIRKNNTWSLRKDGKNSSERPFGGLNLVVSGDAWQFPPIKAFPVYHNPTEMDRVASQATISSMFTIAIMGSSKVKSFF